MTICSLFACLLHALTCDSGRRPSDAPAAAASLDSSSTASGSKYELVLAILEDIGSKAIARIHFVAILCSVTNTTHVDDALFRTCCHGLKRTTTATMSSVSARGCLRCVRGFVTGGAVDMTPKDVDEMVATLQMNAGQKIKFRRELKKRGLCQG